MAEWLASVNPGMPWHISAFHPDYQMRDRPRTPISTLLRAHDIGKAAGLKYIYTGNIPNPECESTMCPICGELLIQRYGFYTKTRWEIPGICHKCSNNIPGVWR